MVVQMLSWRGQPLSRLKARPSFAGTGLLERMRSTTFALLGITAAMGLGLVAVVSQQGWPLLPAAPLPPLPVEQSGIDDATVVTAPQGASASRHGGASEAGRPAEDRGAVEREPAARLSAPRRLETAPPPVTGPAATGEPSHPEQGTTPPGHQALDQPAGGSLPAAPPPNPAPPASTAPAVPPAPTPPPVTASANRGKGNAYGKYKPPGGSKGRSHRSAPATPAPPPASVVPAPDAAPGEVGVPPSAAETAGDKDKGNGHGHAYGHAGR